MTGQQKTSQEQKMPVALLWLFLALCLGVTIKADLKNSHQPVITSQNGGSVFRYNYNAAYIPLHPNSGSPLSSRVDGLLVRVQNLLNASDPYSVGPSKIALAVRQGNFQPSSITFSKITQHDVIIEPSSSEDALGTEDPRLAFDERTNMYYLMYTAVCRNSDGSASANLALATATTNPVHADGWTKRGNLFPQLSWSKSGALLIRNGTSYLFFGDSGLVPGIQVAKTSDLLHYTYNSSIWLPVRPTSWDSLLVEAGPMPLQLSDGTYLFLYNSARKGFPSPKPNWDIEYNIGWVILDKDDPTTILQRSAHPLLSPTLNWEKGIGTSVLGLTPNVVFVEGWQRYPNDNSMDRFLIYLGGADSVVGVAEVVVSIHATSQEKYSVNIKSPSVGNE